MPLTGRFNFRRTLIGKIVLQVEDEVKAAWPFSRKSAYRRRWRDAGVMDLTKPELRAMVDLRSRPQHVVPIATAPSEATAPTALEEAAPVRPPMTVTEGRRTAH